MKYVFEVQGLADKATVGRLRRMMLCFETMVNTTLPEQRVHLKEEWK